MDKIREIDDHVKRNQSTILTNPLFAVTPGEKRKEFRCCYCIYKSGKLWKDNLDRLPNPPTIFNVQQNKSNLSLHVDWKFQNQGYPYNAMILYRTKSNGSGFPWKRQKTSDLSKTIKPRGPPSAQKYFAHRNKCIRIVYQGSARANQLIRGGILRAGLFFIIIVLFTKRVLFCTGPLALTYCTF